MAEIYGAELVTGIFGHWPSFHDAEVVRLVLERTAKYEAGPLLLADVHTFETTPDIDPQGFYVRRHHTLVYLRFDGVQDLELNNFNNQNALSGLVFTEIGSPAFPEPSYEIVFHGVHGVSATFRCREVMVVGVQPWVVETGAPAA
jgi:hypothetical protein